MTPSEVEAALAMAHESRRLATFARWPFGPEAACAPARMAEAGWYAPAGGDDERDLAACHLCGKQMNGWEPTDDPWREHRDHAPLCLFARLGKSEARMTLAEFLALRHQLELNAFDKYRDECRRRFDKACPKM